MPAVVVQDKKIRFKHEMARNYHLKLTDLIINQNLLVQVKWSRFLKFRKTTNNATHSQLLNNWFLSNICA